MPIGTDKPLVILKGEPIEYTSMYGYWKQRFPVAIVDGDGEPTKIGWIKEEKIIGAGGKVVGLMYYERNGWRGHGQQRFYDSPEALVTAFGGTLARKTGLKKPRLAKTATTKARPKKRAKVSVTAKKRRKAA